MVYDAPLRDDKSEAAIRQAAFEVGGWQMSSHFDIGYRGYTSYELCHPLPVVNGNTVDLEFADKNAQLAAEFMRGVIAEAEKAPRLKAA